MVKINMIAGGTKEIRKRKFILFFNQNRKKLNKREATKIMSEWKCKEILEKCREKQKRREYSIIIFFSKPIKRK